MADAANKVSCICSFPDLSWRNFCDGLDMKLRSP